MTIKDSNETIEMKDVPLSWYIRVDDDMDPIADVENIKFEDKEAYDFEMGYDISTKLRQEYDLNSGVEAEIINGVERTPNPPFVINGVKSIDIIIPTIYEGDALPSKVKVKITYAKETQELELDSTLWIKLTENGQVYEEAVAGDLTEKGYLYYPGARIPDEIENLIDRHTVYLTNGKSYLDSAIKPVPRPSSGGAGESESIEVPETSDNVMTALILSLISLTGIIGTSLLKKKITN